MKKPIPKPSAKARVRKEDPIVTVAYRAPRNTLAALDELAAKKGISRNALLSIAVSRLLETGI